MMIGDNIINVHKNYQVITIIIHNNLEIIFYCIRDIS